MVSGFISRLVILIFGTLYPAYASYKAVRTKNVKEYVKWMMYWIVFALFTCAETFTDLFLSFWFPFYYEIKIITVIYLLSPATKGSSILYRKFVHPVLTKREQEIDEYIAKAKEQGYHTMLNLGSKGVNYATSLIMQTAIKGLPNLPITPSSDFLPAKNHDSADIFDLEDESSVKDFEENSLKQGGGGLVNQLRKSYSLSDLTDEQNGTVTDGGGVRPVRRNQGNPVQTLPTGNHGNFYSPGDDLCQQTINAEGEVLYPDDLSSGYSSGDPFYYDTRRAKGDVLVRTASLGPTSRIRTRAATKNGLPKRASLSEGGSTWSTLEPHESQNETDQFNFPLSHSASYPFPLTSLQPCFIPGYQPMLGNIAENQMLAFINHSQYSQVLGNRTIAFQNAFGGVLGSPGNQGVFISEENVSNPAEIEPKADVSDAIPSEGQIDENKYVIANPKMENKDEEVKKVDESVTGNENSVPSLNKSLDGKEKPFQERSGKYNKKPAPIPPGEESVSKSTSSLAVEDEESGFFTPNASPKPSRKQSLSSLDLFSDKTSPDGGNDSKPQANVTVDAPKKSKEKTKKGDFNISKKLHIPKMPFSFWHQKGGRPSSSSDTSSVASVEIASTRAESQGETEFFIPLKNDDERTQEEDNVKEDPDSIKPGVD